MKNDETTQNDSKQSEKKWLKEGNANKKMSFFGVQKVKKRKIDKCFLTYFFLSEILGKIFSDKKDKGKR